MNNEEKLLEQRQEKFKSFFSKNHVWIYVVLILLVIFSFWIRTLNTEKLRDVATGEWTLGPDLDPFLFLRWAEYINTHGSIMENDAMRYVPIGFQTKEELVFLPYLIYWFHKFASSFGFTESMAQSAVYFPAFMFALTVIAFFLFTRRLSKDSLGEKKAGIVALVGCFFLTVIPALLPRTIAGIPEKESAGFFFMFMAFYLFLAGWKSGKINSRIIWGVLAGVATAGMALVWGGYIYIILTIGITLLIAHMLGQIDKDKNILSWVWIAVAYLLMAIFSKRYPLGSILTSTTTLIPLVIIAIGTLDLLFGKYLVKYTENKKVGKIPRPLLVLISLFILGIILSGIVFGPGFIADKFRDVTKPLITPISDRIGVTVAENRQPFFSEWANNFGPHIGGFPIYFWLFIIGAIYIYYKTMWIFDKKERKVITAGYVIFLFAIIFSRYAPDSKLNGTNALSITTYILGVLILLATFGYYYYKMYHSNKDKLKDIDIGLILLFSLFLFSIISARGSVRTIMVLVPVISIIVPYFITDFTSRALSSESSKKTTMIVIAVILIFGMAYSGWQFYKSTKGTAENYAPYTYTYQWQYAMKWVKDNTPANSVFAHWWDYGYWVQTMGGRATVLDGGNAIGYWNHLMGRHGLTAPKSEDALELFKTHEVTHFLIDPTDIGKYSAFSSIGSDENYDRAAYIPTFLKEYAQQRETKNGTIYIYNGGFPLDDDIIYDLNGTKVFLPAGKAVVAGTLIEIDKNGDLTKQPKAVVIYNGIQHDLPLRYAFYRNFTDFGSGIESGVFVYPRIVQEGSGQAIDHSGALLYLSNRTVKSQLARHYLYKENDPYFKLVHSEDSLVVKSIKDSNLTESDFIHYGDFQGPIRIWEVKYPSWVKSNPELLKREYPNKNLYVAR